MANSPDWFNRGDAVIRQALGFTDELFKSYQSIWEYIRPQLSRGKDIKGNVPRDVPSKIRFVHISVDFSSVVPPLRFVNRVLKVIYLYLN